MAVQKVNTQDQEKRKALQEAYEEIVQTEAGQLVLRHIAAVCRHNQPARILNPQSNEVNLISTALNAERKQVYLEIRQWIPIKTRMKIEN